MAKIPENKATTLNAIEQAVKLGADEKPRSHLGASEIGDSCKRKLWYNFRWATLPDFPARMLRLFETGNLYEQRFVKLLRDAGVKVWDANPDGSQFRAILCGGHFGGSLDGVAVGLEEAPKTPHVLELKTHSNKYFNELTKKGVKEAQPRHYAQMMCYMGMMDLTRAYYLAVNKDNEELYGERIKFDQAEYDALKDKAEKIIFSDTAPEKINISPAWYECKFCHHAQICHYDSMPAVNCRTCSHVEVLSSGEWSCAVSNQKLNHDAQLKGCKRHLFNPTFLPWASIMNYDRDNARPAWVEYTHNDKQKTFKNISETIEAVANTDFTSHELSRITGAMVCDKTVHELKATFGGFSHES